MAREPKGRSKSASADSTAEKQQIGVPFQPGQSGNPAGRPKGSRNKLGEAFLADLLTDWESHGKAAITATREKKPDAYLKVVASILPKELNLRVNEFDELTDEQLARRLAAITAQLAVGSVGAGDGVEAEEIPQPTGGVSTLQ